MGVLNDDAIHDLSIQIAPVDCLVPQGGVLTRRPLIVHASSKPAPRYEDGCCTLSTPLP
jgi:hypothetical protein